MATCPECEYDEIDTEDYEEGDTLSCPECGKKSLRKVYTPVGIVFKGSGFYSTDHKSPSGAPRPNNSHAGGENEKSSHDHEHESAAGSKTSSEKGASESAPSSSPTSSAAASSSSDKS